MEEMERLNREEQSFKEWIQGLKAKDEDIRNNIESVEKQIEVKEKEVKRLTEILTSKDRKQSVDMSVNMSGNISVWSDGIGSTASSEQVMEGDPSLV